MSLEEKVTQPAGPTLRCCDVVPSLVASGTLRGDLYSPEHPDGHDGVLPTCTLICNNPSLVPSLIKASAASRAGPVLSSSSKEKS